MVLTSTFLEQLFSITRPKIEEQMLIVIYKRRHEEKLAQPLKTNNKQYKIAVNFPNGYHGIFNVKGNNKVFFIEVFEGAEYNVKRTHPKAFKTKV